MRRQGGRICFAVWSKSGGNHGCNLFLRIHASLPQILGQRQQNCVRSSHPLRVFGLRVWPPVVHHQERWPDPSLGVFLDGLGAWHSKCHIPACKMTPSYILSHCTALWQDWNPLHKGVSNIACGDAQQNEAEYSRHDVNSEI